jgi:hypothetical protein
MKADRIKEVMEYQGHLEAARKFVALVKDGKRPHRNRLDLYVVETNGDGKVWASTQFEEVLAESFLAHDRLDAALAQMEVRLAGLKGAAKEEALNNLAELCAK